MDGEGTAGEGGLQRGPSFRHVQLMAIGGAIGVGLFLGAGSAISTAGPAVLLSYAFAGVVVFFILRAIGELILNRPATGGFASYAGTYVGWWAGYATGWTYWATWVTTAPGRCSRCR